MWDEENKSNSVIGEDLVVTGNILCKSGLLIQGEVEGNVTCTHLQVSNSGRVTGDISTEDALIEGAVNGSITSRKVDLREGCVMEGDIASESLSIDHGANFTGSAKPRKSQATQQVKDAAE